MDILEPITNKALAGYYLEWLEGRSLRALAGKHALGSHYRLWDHFRRRYGPGATDPEKQSLARSILRDYRGKTCYPEVLAWIGENHHLPGFNVEGSPFRSRDTEHHYTQCQTIQDYRLVEEVAWEPPEEPPEPLRLWLFLAVFRSVVSVLGELIGYPDRVESYEAS